MTTEGQGPAITPRTRARARHILDHYYIGPARDPEVLEIWGYTPRMTYAPGDEVALHVSTTAARWSFEVGRDGVTYEPLMRVEGLPGNTRTRPPTVRSTAAAGAKAPASRCPITGGPVAT
jgi:hypothetical protein